VKGETSFGKYRLIAELGQGGMADVFLAVALGPAGFRKLQVIKRVRRGLVEDPEFVTMLLEEGKLSSRLSHPNLIQTNEVGQLGDEYFIAMEYLDGQPLHGILARGKAENRPLPQHLHYGIIADALRGLHHAHELADFDGTPLGIVHRDVSPQNVFVTYDGDVKVVDFGVAKAAGRLHETRAGTLKGKLSYMAPEQAMGIAVDRRADVFAVGVMLWEAATGARLWAGAEEQTILGRLLSGDVPTSPRTVTPDVAPELDRICRRALASRPDDRYPTADAVRIDLDAYLEQDAASSLAEITDVTPPLSVLSKLGPLLAGLFRDRREGLRRVVEVQLRALEEDSRASPLPVSPVPSSSSATAGDEETLIDPSAVVRERARVRPRVVKMALAVAALAGLAGAAAIAIAARGAAHAAHPAGAGAGSAGPAALVSEDCTDVIGDAHAPGAFVFGVIYPRTGQDGDVAKGDVAVHATELALSEIASTVVGLPTAPGGQRRPMAAVVCDSTVNARRAASHLVDDLHLPAVLGALYSADTLNIALGVTIPRGVLMICPFSTSPVLSALADDDLVWRTIAPATYEARALAPLVSLLELRIRHDRHSRAPIRVAMLVNKGTLGLSTAEITTPLLRFNGAKDVQANRESFLRIDYENPKADYGSIAAHIVAFQPDIIVSAGLDELYRNVLPVVEGSWPREAPRPLYALSGDNVESALFPAFVASSPSLRGRVFGVVSGGLRDRRALDGYVIRYRAVFANGGADLRPELAAAAYDAVYALAYAAAAVGGDAPTGRDLARGMMRLVPPGPNVDVGALDLDRAFHLLAGGSNIDLNGAATALDFDTKTGDPMEDVELLCYVDRAAAGALGDGAVYHARTATMTGTLRCPGDRR
jgi:serine/threonine protein kinase/ABC-type branched-subunit amino acid transport system substrate-binding protein